MSPVVNLVNESLVVRESVVHGLGVFATQPVAAGDVLGIYVGRRYPAGVAVELSGDGSLTYLFGLSDGTTIDGADGGNETMYLNHSCEPNCEAIEEWGDGNQLVLKIVAIRALAVGQEVLIDYALTLEPEDDAPYLCDCGAPACRGSMAIR